MAMLNNQRVYNSQLDGLQPYTKMRKKKSLFGIASYELAGYHFPHQSTKINITYLRFILYDSMKL